MLLGMLADGLCKLTVISTAGPSEAAVTLRQKTSLVRQALLHISVEHMLLLLLKLCASSPRALSCCCLQFYYKPKQADTIHHFECTLEETFVGCTKRMKISHNNTVPLEQYETIHVPPGERESDEQCVPCSSTCQQQ
jgi:hypothetical protein